MRFVLSKKNILRVICIFAAGIICAAGAAVYSVSVPADKDGFIKWMDFNASYQAMNDALDADVKSGGKYDWIELLSYLATVNGNNFSKYSKKSLTDLINRLEDGELMEVITKDMKYYDYYYEAYSAVLAEYVGKYSVQVNNPEDEDEPLWETRYGLKVFSPIAAGFGFEHYDDFANMRSYGYRRRHTGHDLFGSIGTPVIAIESGVVECAGWNRYGGWRIGIRSFDKKRYYYYAHLRKDHPYNNDIIKEGNTVNAGDVIGYLGMTGYSTKENVNNINVPHLHAGIQIIFDESQKDGSGEIWIDMYQLTKLLQKNRSEVVRDGDEYVRKYRIYEAKTN